MNEDLKYKVVVDCDWQQAQHWCEHYIGKFDQDWYKLGIDIAAATFGDTSTTWYFKKEADAILFTLRWQ